MAPTASARGPQDQLRHPATLTPDGADQSTWWLPATLAACHHARHHVSQRLRRWGCDDDVVTDAVLLVSELTSNVVRHTPSRSVGIELTRTATRVVISLHEQAPEGPPDPERHLLFDFGSVRGVQQAERPGTSAATQPSGRGLKILDALATEWGVSRSQRSTSTWFSLAAFTSTTMSPPLPTRRDPAAAATVEALEASVRRLQRLLRITEGLAAATTPAQVGVVVTAHLREHLQAVFTGVALVDPGRTTMRYVSLDPLPAATTARWARFAHDNLAPVSTAAITGQAYFHETPADAEAEFPGISEHMAQAGTAAMAHLPLTVAGHPIGTLAVAWTHPRPIDADTRALLAIVAGAAGQALQRAAWRTDPYDSGH